MANCCPSVGREPRHDVVVCVPKRGVRRTPSYRLACPLSQQVDQRPCRRFVQRCPILGHAGTLLRVRPWATPTLEVHTSSDGRTRLRKPVVRGHLDSRDRVNRPALERELERCYPVVLRGLVAVAGSRELAEDAMQEAIVAALRQNVMDVRRLDAWLYVVGIRKLKHSRWKQRLNSPLQFLHASSPAGHVRGRGV